MPTCQDLAGFWDMVHIQVTTHTQAGLRIRIDLMRIRIQHFFYLRIRIQDFDDQKLKKFKAEKKLIFFYHKLQFTYP